MTPARCRRCRSILLYHPGKGYTHPTEAQAVRCHLDKRLFLKNH